MDARIAHPVQTFQSFFQFLLQSALEIDLLEKVGHRQLGFVEDFISHPAAPGEPFAGQLQTQIAHPILGDENGAGIRTQFVGHLEFAQALAHLGCLLVVQIGVQDRPFPVPSLSGETGHPDDDENHQQSRSAEDGVALYLTGIAPPAPRAVGEFSDLRWKIHLILFSSRRAFRNPTLTICPFRRRTLGEPAIPMGKLLLAVPHTCIRMSSWYPSRTLLRISSIKSRAMPAFSTAIMTWCTSAALPVASMSTA